MKRLALLLILLIPSLLISQSCLPEGITFTTQVQIDSFQSEYPDCTEIEGNVEIVSNNITNLNGLNVLTSFGGDLSFTFARSLYNLSGLDNVTAIAGDLSFDGNHSLINLTGLEGLTSILGSLLIGHHQGMVDLTGLENLVSIGGNLRIGNNSSLTSFIGLEGLTSIGRDLSITTYDIIDFTGLNNLTSIGGGIHLTRNHALTSLTGLENVTSVEGIAFGSNYKLTSLEGLDNLTTIGSYLYIDTNPLLTSLSGLEDITSIGGDLYIYSNPLLTSLTGLEDITSIGGDLSIMRNDVLNSLIGLHNIDASSITNLSISENDSLSYCEVESICNYLVAPNGIIAIYGNESGCNNPTEVADACGITLSCLLYGNYYFSTQDEIDSFQSDFPDCTDIEGNVRIQGDDITSLEGLNVMTSIGGDLRLSNNHNLTSLTGLDSLTTVGGHLSIHYNSKLINLTGLDNVASAGGSLSVGYNPLLTSVAELYNLNSVNFGIYISENNDLTSLYGLNNITTDTSLRLFIYDNSSLSECEVESVCYYLANPQDEIFINNNKTGCNSREEVEEACVVSVEENYLTANLTIHPNPFTTTTTIQYELTHPQTVTITFYNQFGKQVDIIRQDQSQGLQKVVWTPNNLVNGVYYFRLQLGEQVASGKVVLMR